MTQTKGDEPKAGEEPESIGLPSIQDEAADTPTWIPILGLVLLGLMALVVVYRSATAERNDAPDAIQAEPAAEAAPLGAEDDG